MQQVVGLVADHAPLPPNSSEAMSTAWQRRMEQAGDGIQNQIDIESGVPVYNSQVGL